MVVGKRGALTLILTAVLAGGHVLIEDLPGLGKTLIARSFAAALGLEFKRVQFTPDLLPADLLGSTVYDMQSGRFEFRPGPIFTNLLLADEINRTPPKTQAALLESMAEGQVSIDGVTHKLPAPFIVLATDNPIEYEGTYPLPEAQLDRFTIRLELRYLSEQEEASMLRRRIDRGSAEPTVHQVVDAHELLAMREVGGAGHRPRRRAALRGVTGRGDASASAGRGRRQPAGRTRPRSARPRPRAAARPRLRDPRGRQVACRSVDGAPDQPASGDVGAPGARQRRGGGAVAPASRAADQRRDAGVIETRSTEAQLRWRPSPLTLAILTCAAVLLAVAVIGSLWQLVAFAAPLLGVVCSIGWQRPVPAVVVRADPGSHRCFETEQAQVTVWATAAPETDSDALELTVSVVTRDANRRNAERESRGRRTVVVAADRWGRYPIQGRVTVGARGGLLQGTGVVDAADVFVFPIAPPQSTAIPRTELLDRLGTHLTRHIGPGVEYADVRRYVPGDQLRTVNWPVSARRGSLHVTERLTDRAADVVVLVDNYPQPAGAGDRGHRPDRARRGSGRAERAAQR